MELRDWFAGQALAGFTSSKRYCEVPEDDLACMAYEQADAMIEERERSRKPASPYRDPAPETVETPEDEVA